MDVDGVTELLERAALEAPLSPAWNSEVSRAVRRRRRVRLVGAVAVPVAMVAAITIALTSLGPSPELALSPTGPPPPSVPAVKLAGAATSIGVVFGDTWTNASREAIFVRSAATLKSDLSRVGLPGEHALDPVPGYLFELTGHFTCHACYSTARENGVMRHEGPLHPVALFGFVAKSGDHRQFFGGTTNVYDLSRLGAAFAIPPASMAPTNVPVRLTRPYAPRHHRNLAGRVAVTDERGAAITTVVVPRSGRASVSLKPGQYYTFTGSHLDGRSCASRTGGATGTDRIPVIAGVHLPADVYCDS